MFKTKEYLKKYDAFYADVIEPYYSISSDKGQDSHDLLSYLINEDRERAFEIGYLVGMLAQTAPGVNVAAALRALRGADLL